jgi:acetyl esterase/lipase
MLRPMTTTLPAARLSALLLGFSGLLLSACQPAYFKVLNAGVDPGTSNSSIYDAEHGLSLDVYPARNATGPAPVVVFFYGGSWQSGRREYYRFVGEALSARGVVVVIPDYRKAPQFVFPAFMHDAAAATAWTIRHAAELGGDPSRVHVMGHSAGGHIAALLGTDARYLARWNVRTRQLAGVIGLAGPYDFLPIVDPSLKRVFGAEADWPDSQPVNFVDGDEPPFLLMHGGSDRRVWPMNSEHLAARLDQHGETVSLRIIAHTGHIGLVNGFYSPRFSPVLEETLAWINQAKPAPERNAEATISGD